MTVAQQLADRYREIRSRLAPPPGPAVRVGPKRVTINAPQVKTEWTPSLCASLMALWDEGLSCREIARRLGGGITRLAVIGKAHRLDLPTRSKIVLTRKPRPAPKVRQPKPPRPVVVKVKPPAPIIIKPAKVAPQPAWIGPSVSFVERHPKQCVWPVAGAPGPFMQCCGGPVSDQSERSPYCERHFLQSLSLDSIKAISRRPKSFASL